jgi:hypothetical protein
MFDDLDLLRQAGEESFAGDVALFRPSPALRLPNRSSDKPGHQGRNPAAGVVLHYWLPQDLPQEAALELVISGPDGEPIRTFTRKPEKEGEEKPKPGDEDKLLSAEAGLNWLEWNMRYPSVERFEKLVLWNDYLDGPKAVPGTYRATLAAGTTTAQTELEIRSDPRGSATPEELQQQFEFAWSINRKLTDTHKAITKLRAARTQIEAFSERAKDREEYADLLEMADSIKQQLTQVEEALYQTQLEARQDPLNFPIRLNDKLAGVMLAATIGDHPPTASAIAVRDELFAAVDSQLGQLEKVLGPGIDDFNKRVAELQLPAVSVDNTP